jgi:hypothetical protein
MEPGLRDREHMWDETGPYLEVIAAMEPGLRDREHGSRNSEPLSCGNRAFCERSCQPAS